MKEMMALADEVKLAREEALRKVERKESGAHQEQYDVAHVVVVADVHDLLIVLADRLGRNYWQKERQIGEHPEHTTGCKL